jgi:hypothetical protein
MSDEQSNTQTSNTGSSKAPSKKDAIHSAFLLGWLIMELRSRFEVQLKAPSSSGGLHLASQWRALFTRVADLQSTTFPNAITAKTLYDPPRVPYLHPNDTNTTDAIPPTQNDSKPAADYADIGICTAFRNGEPILKQFALYEETRRAINALSLLYVEEGESLIPDELRSLQLRLINAVLGKNSSTNADKVEADARNAALKKLTEQTQKFLDAWDGYIRENYFVGGIVPNDELELIAYYAGNSLAGLSWSVSAKTAYLESINQDGASETADQTKRVTDECLKAWKGAFQGQDIIRLQHQISALSSELDDDYYAANKDVKRPDEGTTTTNPDLPSQAILAVKRSIDYWQRTVEWIDESDKNKATMDTKKWREMRLALTEQANIWQSLMTGQQSLRSFNLETITRHIMKEVTDKIQASLHQGFKASLVEVQAAIKEVAEVAAEDAKIVVGTIGDVAKKGLAELVEGSRAHFRLLVAVGSLLIVVLIGFGIAAYLKMPVGAGSVGSVGGFGGLLTILVGYLHLGNATRTTEANIKTVDQQKTTATDSLNNVPDKLQKAQDASTNTDAGFLGRLEGAAGDIRASVVTAFEKGYLQMRIELAALGHSAAVAYPLVEFFVTTFHTRDGETEVRVLDSFLEEIIWSKADRDEEVERVISAAFGPLAAFMTAVKPEVKK